MEKLDAIVALAGGAILVVAIVGAAMNDGVSPQSFEVIVRPTAGVEDIPLTLQGSGASIRGEATYEASQGNLTSVTVVVFFNATAFPTGASAHLKVTAPDGNASESDANAAPAGSSLRLSVDVSVSQAPASATVAAASAQGALDALAADAGAGSGNWSIEVSYAPGPVAPPGVSTKLLVAWSAWEASASPAPPASR